MLTLALEWCGISYGRKRGGGGLWIVEQLFLEGVYASNTEAVCEPIRCAG